MNRLPPTSNPQGQQSHLISSQQHSQNTGSLQIPSQNVYNTTLGQNRQAQQMSQQSRPLYRPGDAVYSSSQPQAQIGNQSASTSSQQQYITLESQRNVQSRDHTFVAPSPIPAHLQSAATPGALTPYQAGTPGYPPSIGASTPMTPRTPADLGVGPPQLQNIVSTVNLGCKLDLKRIALHARNAEYNPKRFAAVIMRIREPRTTALIFSSGKMVCTGAKSEKESRMAARKYARVVQKLGFEAKFIDFRIQNMVGSVDVRFPIRLEGLVLTHSQFSSYEPELFPGLIYRMVKPRIVLLIFVSGKVVLTGAKVRSEIEEAFNNIYPILKGFRKLT